MQSHQWQTERFETSHFSFNRPQGRDLFDSDVRLLEVKLSSIVIKTRRPLPYFIVHLLLFVDVFSQIFFLILFMTRTKKHPIIDLMDVF